MNLLSHHFNEERPWGSFENFTLNEQSTVKILRIAPNSRFSLQKHKVRSEYWQVIQGYGVAQSGDEIRDVKIGDEIQMHPGDLHRLSGGPEGISVLEISFGTFDENDIERVEDDFGRT
jgi:mannose-1-phosphate guanylyltransferase/mannose-6-phosphate isomerase